MFNLITTATAPVIGFFYGSKLMVSSPYDFPKTPLILFILSNIVEKVYYYKQPYHLIPNFIVGATIVFMMTVMIMWSWRYLGITRLSSSINGLVGYSLAHLVAEILFVTLVMSITLFYMKGTGIKDIEFNAGY